MTREEVTKLYERNFKDYPDIMGVSQLSKMLAISKAKAYELIKDKKIWACIIAEAYKIPKVSVIEYLVDITFEE